jgi:hypothetical protein
VKKNMKRRRRRRRRKSNLARNAHTSVVEKT